MINAGITAAPMYAAGTSDIFYINTAKQLIE